MRVSVVFEDFALVVPVAEDNTIGQLKVELESRFRTLTSKSLTVNTLRNKDDAILFPSDKVSDVLRNDDTVVIDGSVDGPVPALMLRQNSPRRSAFASARDGTPPGETDRTSRDTRRGSLLPTDTPVSSFDGNGNMSARSISPAPGILDRSPSPLRSWENVNNNNGPVMGIPVDPIETLAVGRNLANVNNAVPILSVSSDMTLAEVIEKLELSFGDAITVIHIFEFLSRGHIDNEKDKSGKHGLPRAVINAMRAHVGNPLVQECAAKAIRNFAASASFQHVFLRRGGMDWLATMIRTHYSNTATLLAAIAAVEAFCRSSSMGKACFAFNCQSGASLLASATLHHTSNTDINDSIMRLLRHLSLNSETLRALILRVMYGRAIIRQAAFYVCTEAIRASLLIARTATASDNNLDERAKNATIEFFKQQNLELGGIDTTLSHMQVPTREIFALLDGMESLSCSIL
mmetsp:Transcript_13443/g.22516  ORF Transcript_13443/g.22516 Transcript_13443/m.22516 type:complete len:462 (+) Transcript_13443:137-1522(+)